MPDPSGIGEPKKINARGTTAEIREYIPVHPNPFHPKGIFQSAFCVYRKHRDKRLSRLRVLEGGSVKTQMERTKSIKSLEKFFVRREKKAMEDIKR